MDSGSGQKLSVETLDIKAAFPLRFGYEKAYLISIEYRL
jgi:hypothetical protein